MSNQRYALGMSVSESPAHHLEGCLRRGECGVIETRQSTYWEITLGHDEFAVRYRVHVRGKAEAHFASRDFAGGGLFDEHPVLMDYGGAHARVNISAPARDVDGVRSALQRAVAEWSDGWRTLEAYEGDAADMVLRHGNGVLLSGPVSLVKRVVEIADRCGLGPYVLDGRERFDDPRMTALVLGRSFVIGTEFVVEQRAV